MYEFIFCEMASVQQLIDNKTQLHYHLLFLTSDERNKKYILQEIEKYFKLSLLDLTLKCCNKRYSLKIISVEKDY